MKDHPTSKPSAPRTSGVATVNTTVTPELLVSAGRRSAAVGDELTYRLRFANPSSGPLTAVRLWASVPRGTAFQSADAGGIHDAAGGTVTWDFDELPPGRAGEVAFTARVAEGAHPESVVCDARLECGEAEHVAASSPTVRVDAPRVSLVLTPSATEAVPGDIVLFTVTWASVGSSSPGPGELTAVLPAHGEVMSVTGGGVILAEEGCLGWRIPDLSPGATDTVIFTVRLDSALPAGQTVLETQAFVAAPGLASRAQSERRQVVCTAAPRLAGTLRIEPSTVSPGGRFVAMLAVTNTGNAHATDAILTIPAVPRGRITADGRTDAEARRNESSGSVELALGSIPVGATPVTEWAVELAEAFPPGRTTLPMGVRVSALGCSPLLVTGEDVVVDAAPILEVDLQVAVVERHGNVAHPGDTLVYTVSYHNRGSADARRVVVGLRLPERTTLVGELTTGAAVDRARGQVLTRLESLPAGHRGELQVGVRLAAIYPAGTSDVACEAGIVGEGLEQVLSPSRVTRVRAAPALTVDVVPSSLEASPGDRLTFVVRCRNTGNAPAADAWTSATLPHGVELLSAGRGASVSAETGEVRWPLGDLRPGAEQSARCVLRLPGTFPAGRSDVSVAGAAGWVDGEVSAVSAPVMVEARPEISVELVADPTTAEPGQVVRYRITLRNTGNAVATGARVVLETEERAALLGPDTSGLFELEPLPPGSSAALELQARLASVFPAGESRVSATATFAGSGLATIASPAVVTRVVATPSLVVGGRVDRDESEPGGTLAYEVECRNTGNAPAEDALLSVTLPEGASLLSSSGGGVYDDAQQTVRWRITELPSGGVSSVAFLVRLADSFRAGVTALRVGVTAVCAAPNADPTPECSVETRVRAMPALTSTVTTEPSSAAPGERVRVMASCSNLGNAPAADTVLNVHLPAGCTVESAASGGHFDAPTRLFSWPLGEVRPNGEAVARSVELRLNPVFPAGETTLQVSSGAAGQHSTAAPSRTSFEVLASARLSVHLSVDRKEALPGDALLYTVALENRGNADAGPVVLRKALPPGTSFVSATSEGLFDELSETVTWRLPRMGPGERSERVVALRLDELFPAGLSIVTSEATAEHGAGDADERGQDVTSNEQAVTVRAVPELRVGVVVTAPDAAAPGSEVVLTVNCDAYGRSEATDTRVVLALPEYLSITSASPESTGTPGAERTEIAWSAGAMVPGASFNATVVCVLADELPAGKVIHEARAWARSEETGRVDAAPATFSSEAWPSINLSLTADPPVLRPGEPLTIRCELDNQGGAATAGCRISVPIPPTFRDAAQPAGSGPRLDMRERCLRFDSGALGRGESRVHEWSIVGEGPFPAGRSRIAFSAGAESAEGAVAGCPPAAVQVVAAPELTITGVAEPVLAPIGAGITVRFTTTNTGDAAASELRIVCRLPTGVHAETAGGNAQVAEHSEHAVIWSQRTLDVGAATTVTLRAVPRPVFPPGRTRIPVSVDVTAHELEAPLRSDTLEVTVEAVLSLTGRVDVSEPLATPGDSVAVAVELVNDGTAATGPRVLKLPLPPRAAVEHITAGGRRVGGEHDHVEWLIPDLEAGATSRVTAILRLDSTFPAGRTKLLFTANAAPPDRRGETIALSAATVDVVATPVIALTSSCDPVEASPGDRVRFQLVVRNNGNAVAEALVVSDTVPERCTTAEAPVWAIGTMAPGDSRSLEWWGQLAAAFPIGTQVLDNGPTAMCAAECVVEAETGSVSVHSVSNLGVRLRVATDAEPELGALPPVFEPGDRFELEIELLNGGEADEFDVRLALDLPHPLRADGPTEWSLERVAAGARKRRSLTIAVPDETARGRHQLCTVARVESGDVGVTRALPLVVRACPELEVALTCDRTVAVPGESVSVTVACAVVGRAHAEDVRLTLTCPPGLELARVDDGELNQDEVQWRIPTLGSHATTLATCVFLVPAAERPGVLDMTLRATASAEGTDTVESSPTELRVLAEAAVEIVPQPVPEDQRVTRPGGTVRPRFLLRSVGTAPASDLRIVVPVPDLFLPASASAVDLELRAAEWRVTRLSPGEEQEFELALIAADADARGVAGCEITARVTGAELTTPVIASLDLSVLSEPALTVETAVDVADASPGQRLTFSITVANTGHATAEQVRVQDRIPGLITVEEVTAGGTWDAVQGIIVWEVAALPAGSAPVTVQWSGRLPELLEPGRWEAENDASAWAEDVVGMSPESPARTRVEVAGQLAVGLEATATDLAAGEETTLTVTVANEGTAMARDIVVRLQGPPELATLSTDRLTLADLAPGDRTEGTVTLRAAPVQPAALNEGVVEALATSETADPQRATIALTYRAESVVDLVMTTDRDYALAGGSIQVSIEYEIGGSTEPQDLRIMLPVPRSTTVVEHSAGGQVVELADGAVVRWSPEAVALDSAGVLGCRLQLPASLGRQGELELVAVAEAREMAPTKTAPLAIGLVTAPYVHLDIATNRSEARPGDRVKYELRVRNTGDAPARGVVIRNPIPPGCSFARATAGGVLDETIEAVIWERKLIQPGAATQVEWIGVLDQSFPAGITVIDNMAAVSAESTETGDGCWEADAECTTRVVAAPQLQLEAGLSARSARPGQTVAAAVSWRNVGNAAATGGRLHVLGAPGVARVIRADGGEIDADGVVQLGRIEPEKGGQLELELRLEPVFPSGKSILSLQVELEAAETDAGDRISASIGPLRVDADPRLSLTGAVAPAIASRGDEVQYLLRWSNLGDAPAADGRLQAVLPDCTVLHTAEPPPDGPARAGRLTWPLGELAAAGGEGTITLVLRIDEALEPGETPLVLDATLDAGSVHARLDAPLRTIARAAPNPVVVIAGPEGTTAPGMVVPYQVTVRNDGDAEARRVVARFPLPGRTRFVSAAGSRLSGGDDAREVLTDLGTLKPGESTELCTLVQLDPVFPPGETRLAAQVRVEGQAFEPVISAAKDLLVFAAPSLELGLTLAQATAGPGETVGGQLQLTNRGNAPWLGGVLTLALPPGVTAAASSDGAAADTACRSLTWPAIDLPPGTTLTTDVTCTLRDWFPAGTSELSFVAHFGEGTAPATGEVTASGAMWVSASPTLGVELVASDTSPRPGAEIQLVLRAENTGNAPAEGLSLELALPARAQLVGTSGEVSEDERTVRWHTDSMAAGSELSQIVVVRLDPEFPSGLTTLSARAMAGASNAPAAPDSAVSLAVRAAPRLVLHPTCPKGTLGPGSRFDYQLTVESAGDAAASGVRLLVSAAARTTITTLSEAGVATGDRAHWNLGLMPQGARKTVEMTLLVDAELPQGQHPVAPEIGVIGSDLPRSPAEIPPLVATAASDLRVDVKSESSVAMGTIGTTVSTRSAGTDDRAQEAEPELVPVGVQLTYTLRISNHGTAAAVEAVVEHALPPGSSFQSASDGGRYVSEGHRVIWQLGTVPAGTADLVRTTEVRFGG